MKRELLEHLYALPEAERMEQARELLEVARIILQPCQFCRKSLQSQQSSVPQDSNHWN